MSRLAPVALLIAFALAALLACNEGDSMSEPAPPGASPERVTVTVGDASFDAEVSETSAERGLGLGERDSLAAGAGMLFVFSSEGEHSFWMKGMRFPLDFIWISGEREVVALTENVPPPEPGASNDDLELFDADVETQYVLEVNAGVVTEAGIAVGDAVAIEPDVDPELAQ